MGDELKPCPFCGGTEQRVKSSGRWGWFVSCKCCAVGPSATSKDEAIAAWNHRADDTESINALNRAAGNWARADAENRELRELVICMYQTIKGMNLRSVDDWLPCTRSCPYWECGDCADLPDDECWFELRMRGLGIEVER